MFFKIWHPTTITRNKPNRIPLSEKRLINQTHPFPPMAAYKLTQPRGQPALLRAGVEGVGFDVANLELDAEARGEQAIGEVKR
jgi:hypothetical protein